MQAADIGIERIEVREEELQSQTLPGPVPGLTLQISSLQPPPGSPPPSQKVFRVFTWHKRNETAEDVPFDLSDESDGTRKLFEFIGGWLRALTIGATLFVDELDRSLHPYITRFLVTLFHGSKNTKNAQLIFTTHDTTLLDANRLRRDQIWFVEKDAEQSTSLYPLLDYRRARMKRWNVAT
jgi:AAA15 family ATPase/GTPase